MKIWRIQGIAFIAALFLLTACSASSGSGEGRLSTDMGLSSTSGREELLAAASYFVEDSVAAAKFSMINITFYGDSRTSRAFTWHTDASITGSDIRYAPVRDGAADTLRTQMRSGEGGVSEDQETTGWHKAIVDNLQPGVEYRYQLGDAEQDIWGPVGSFRMAEQQDDFTFLFVSDAHVRDEKSAGVVSQALERALETAPDAEFVVQCGDFVHNANEPEQWRLAMETNRHWLTCIPNVPVAGNHDNDDGAFSRYFHLPSPRESDPEKGAFYSFRYGPVHFVVLNTNEWTDDYGYLSKKQTAWMRGDVRTARQSGAQWIIVLMHRGVYTLGENAENKRITQMRASLPALFDELRVDLVLQGHDHIASRTKPLKNGVPADEGVLYLNSGPIGRYGDELNTGMPDEYFALFDFWTQRPLDREYQSFYVIRAEAGKAVSGTLYETYRAKDAPVYTVDRFTLPLAAPAPEPSGEEEALFDSAVS